jgi:predicted transposase YdaD
MVESYHGVISEIRNEGRAEGWNEGRRQGQKEMILQLLKNFSLEEVAGLLNMELSDISKIIE